MLLLSPVFFFSLSILFMYFHIEPTSFHRLLIMHRTVNVKNKQKKNFLNYLSKNYIEDLLYSDTKMKPYASCLDEKPELDPIQPKCILKKKYVIKL